LNQRAFGSNLLQSCKMGSNMGRTPQIFKLFPDNWLSCYRLSHVGYVKNGGPLVETSLTNSQRCKGSSSFLIVGRWNPYLMTRHGTKYVVEHHEQLIFVESPHAYKVIK
jgi:hypothetical protein